MSETPATYTVIDDHATQAVPSRTVALRTVTCNGEFLSSLLCHFRGTQEYTETRFIRFRGAETSHFSLSAEELAAFLDALADFVAPSHDTMTYRHHRIISAAVQLVNAMRNLLDEDDLAPLFGELDDACTAAHLTEILPGDEEHFSQAG